MKTILRLKVPGLSVILFIFQICTGQELKELNIGDPFPDLKINVSNFEKGSINISDERGKIIIIDFWSPSCIPCIKSFPRIDSLQSEFGKKIQIILVSRESKQVVDQFFEKRKQIKRPGVPFITSDSVLHKLFPHDGNPYHVWIDKNGTICYMTGGYNATRENITGFLHEQSLKLTNFKKPIYRSSLFDSSYFNSINFFSYIANCRKDMHLSGDRKEGYDQIVMNCVSVSEMFIKAFNEGKKHSFDKPGRLSIEINDSFIYVRPKDIQSKEKWFDSYSFNYHLLVPTANGGDKYKIMQTDLKRFFGIEARIERKNVSCLVLKRTSNLNKLKSNGGESRYEFYIYDVKSGRNDPLRYLQNVAYKSFLTSFRSYIEQAFKKSLIDSTEIEGQVDISFKGNTIDAADLKALNKELAIYDLVLVEEQVALDVLVLTKRKEFTGR